MNRRTERQIDRLSSPEGLAQTCWEFSNALGEGRWGSRYVTEVEINRSVVDVIGRENSLVEPIVSRLHVQFSAVKHEDDDGRQESYRIRTASSQEIDESEIPPFVMDAIFGEHGEEVPDDLHDHDYTDLDLPDRDMLDEVVIEREHSIEYVINQDGEIIDYSIGADYLFDGDSVHDHEYRESLEQGEGFIAVNNGIEFRPAVLTPLTKEVIDVESKRIEQRLAELGMQDEITEGVTRVVHTKRALSMLAIISSGMLDLKDVEV